MRSSFAHEDVYNPLGNGGETRESWSLQMTEWGDLPSQSYCKREQDTSLFFRALIGGGIPLYYGSLASPKLVQGNSSKYHRRERRE